MTTRKITTYYEAADGTEPDITVTVCQLDRFTVEVEDTDDVPPSERAGIVERATEAYWAAERTAYLAGNPDAE